MRILNFLALGLLVVLGVAVAGRDAMAAPIQSTTYQVNGQFKDGSLLTGSFDFDGSNVSNVNIATSVHTYTTLDYSQPSIYRLSTTETAGSGSYTLTLFFYNPLDDQSQPISFGTESDGLFNRMLNSGSIGPVSVVTPIPAALPLAASALAGLGGLGLLKRRRTHAHVTAAI